MIAETIQRLAGVSQLKIVGGAADFQKAADSNPKAVPAAFVIAARESAQASPTYSRVRQKVTAGVVIVLVVKNLADASGEASVADMAALRAAVDAALLGWAPTPEHDPYQFESGSLAAFRDGHMWWQDAYRTQFSKSSA